MVLDRKYKEKIAWFIAIGIMLSLFYSSSQPYQEQDVTPLLSEFIKPIFVDELSGVKFLYANQEISIDALGYYHFLEFFIRKGAHFLSYFMIGCSLSYALHVKKSLRLIILVLMISVSYAIFDEWHQSLTPFRTPLIEDVILDSFGSLTGIVFYLLSQKVKRFMRKAKI